MEIAYNIFALIAGLGAFLMGFKIMSESAENLANSGLKNLFAKTSKNSFIGIGIGAVTTCIIQSSSVTTVMVVGFVNAGLMTLYQAANIIMGANIGTTITAQIVALQSFNVTNIAIAFTGIGIFINMFSKKDRIKTIGYALAGFGLIFLGLKFMSNSMSTFSADPAVANFLSSINNPFLLLFVGIAITALVQSSSAVTSLLITMVGAGMVIGSAGNSNAVLYIVLGTNIGTCVTALLSSIGANINARRTALFHLLFNFFGAAVFMIVLLSWSTFMDDTFAKLFPDLVSTQIAMFHTFFNIVATLLFIPFTNKMVKLTQWIIKGQTGIITESVTFMDERILNTPPIAVAQLKKEVIRMSDMAAKAFNIAANGFLSMDLSANQVVRDINDKIIHLNRDIIKYLVKVSTNTLSYSDETTISALHHATADVLRVADLADNITKYTAHAKRDDMVFSEAVIAELRDMIALIDNLYQDSRKTFETNDRRLLKSVDEKEDMVDNLRKNLIASHIKRLNDGDCQPKSSGVFINLVSNLERAADHYTYIAHYVEGIEK